MRTTSYLILYDGVCGLCNGAVRFVLARDRARSFQFAALEREFARELLERHGIVPDADTVVLIVDYESDRERALLRYRAVREVLAGLGGGWRVLGRLAGVVPARFGDRLYEFIAARRYRWFGRLERCPVPEPEVRDRFVG